MAKPTLLTVDDDPEVLRAVERDLRREYGDRYRVLRAESGATALEALRQLKLRGDPVALLLVDQRMPGMTGVELLEQATQLFPTAKRALLTAYADTDAAIRAINRARIDYYLQKPWDPPEERLYPVLNDLLDDWQANYRPGYEGIRILGHRWSPDAHELKDFLARNQVPYRWLDVESNPEGEQLLTQSGLDAKALPVVLFPDGGEPLVQPDVYTVAERAGLRTRAEQPFYDLAIVGGGPAGLAAAVYGASEGLRTIIIEQEAPGGQAGTSSRIENYLGFPAGLSGGDLARRAVTQARKFGAEILAPQTATGLRVDGPYRHVRLREGQELNCHALMLAVGVSYRKLEVPGVERLTGAGVYYGAAMTGAIDCQNQDVYIVGAGNSAGQAAMYLARYAQHVSLLVRGDDLDKSMSQYLIERVPAASLFIFIGASPRTEWLDDVLERDRRGFLLTGPDLLRDGKPPRGWPLERAPFLLEASVPGVFAAGDVRHGSVKRVASGVGEGSVAISFIHQYLAEL